MLTYKPEKRITAAAALSHRWFKENSAALSHQDTSVEESKDLIQSLQHFHV